MSNKYFQTPFASDGDKAEIADLPQSDGTVSYQTGYGADYETNPAASGGKFMFLNRSQMNYLLNEITSNLKQWQEQGYYTYNPAIKYGIGGRCNYNDGTGLKVYVSTAAKNTGVPSINGVLQSGWQLFVGGRIKLSSNIKFYVSPAGNDANDGLTAATPKKTFWALTKMLEGTYDFNSYHVDIYLAAGTYTGETLYINRNYLLNAGNIYIRGAGTTQTIISANSGNGDGTYTTRSGIVIRGNAGDYAVYLTDLGFVNNINHILVNNTARVAVHNLQLGHTQTADGSNTGNMFHISQGSYLNFYTVNDKTGTISITGDANIFIYFNYWSQIVFANTNIVFSGTRKFAAFVQGFVSSHMQFLTTVTFGGSVTNVAGKKFNLDWSGNINSTGQGISALPGNVAGTVNTSRHAYYS